MKNAISVALSAIVPDANQPRKYFPPEKQFSLKESIKKHGIMSPLIVQEISKGKYLLVDGERRYRAAEELKLKEVPAVVEPPSSAAERIVRQFNVQEQHEAWTPTEKAQAIIIIAEELKLSLSDACKLLNVLPRQSRAYVAFASLIDKDSFIKNEVALDLAVPMKSITEGIKGLYERVLEKEFTASDQKRLERRIITSVKNGEILRRSDITKLKDSFQKDPKLVEKYLKDDKVTPTGLFLESNAKGANALRNFSYSCNYVRLYGSTFLNQPDVKISPEQLHSFSTALSVLKKVIDLA